MSHESLCPCRIKGSPRNDIAEMLRKLFPEVDSLRCFLQDIIDESSDRTLCIDPHWLIFDRYAATDSIGRAVEEGSFNSQILFESGLPESESDGYVADVQILTSPHHGSELNWLDRSIIDWSHRHPQVLRRMFMYLFKHGHVRMPSDDEAVRLVQSVHAYPGYMLNGRNDEQFWTDVMEKAASNHRLRLLIRQVYAGTYSDQAWPQFYFWVFNE